METLTGVSVRPFPSLPGSVNIRGCKRTWCWLFVILPVPSFRRSHQEVICWHPGVIYSLDYLFISVFYNLFPLLCAATSSWGSIKFISSYFRVFMSVHESSSGGNFALKCRCQINPDSENSRGLISLTTHRREKKKNAYMQRDKRNQNSGDILSAFPDWGLKRAGNTEKALKMSHSVSCHYMLCEILQAASLSWGLEGGDRWNADVDNSCWRIVHHKVFLPRTAAAHVFVRQRARGACSEDFLQDEDTPAVVKRVLAVPDTSGVFPGGGGGGGGGGLLC